MSSSQEDESYIMECIHRGVAAELRELEQSYAEFPHGRDSLGSSWLNRALSSNALAAVRWMIEQDVSMDARDDDGYTPLHTALERDSEDRYEILELLLRAGADVNARGFNDWTPLHKAAAGNDIEACKILLRYGADPKARTRIDDYATPEGEAKILGAKKAAKFLHGKSRREPLA